MALRDAFPGRKPIGGALLFASVALAMAVSGCGLDILDVDDSSIIVPADLDAEGPAAIPALVNGVVGSYHQAVGGLARYAALLTDEMVLAGTFPTRRQVDIRRVEVSNADLADEMYAPLHRARFQADTTAYMLEQRLDDPAFEDSRQLMLEGIAIARLYSGYSRLWLAELYCWSILTGMYPEEAPLLPGERVEDALEFLEDAAARASTLPAIIPVQIAAVVGQARAHLWLGNLTQAAGFAASIPRGFYYRAEYSGNDPEQYNPVYTFTWGDTQSIRWTVGDGSVATTGGERWPHLEEFLALGMLRSRPVGYMALDERIPVVLQTIYNEPGTDILMAPWTEAALIMAEVAVRLGQTETAEDVLNDLRSDFALRASVEWRVNPPSPGDFLPDLVLTGDPTLDLVTIAAERARELWLTGDRLSTARRLRLDPSVDIDLFPPKGSVGGGDDIAFPIVQREIDANPFLDSGDACPVGQAPGSWR